VIVGHLDSLANRQELKELAETGCFLEYDIFGWENTTIEVHAPIFMMSDLQRMETLEYLIEEGHLDQILIAQDICQKWHLKRFGGRTYAHILNVIIPRMRRRGFTEEHIDAMLVDNPARALTFA
jgi:phosphotriesterase-related protein